MASIQLAWEQNADAVEFDVYLTKDKQIVLLHDKSLKRTAGIDREIQDCTVEELAGFEVGGWKAERFRGERIPLLSEVLESIPLGKQCFIEIKCGPEIVVPLQQTLAKAKPDTAQLKIIAFSDEVIATCKSVMPEYEAYWLVKLVDEKKETERSLNEVILRTKEIHADGLNLACQEQVLNQQSIKDIRDSGLSFFVWTVNDLRLAMEMRKLGVDGITTDRPGWMRAQLEMHDASE